jgi:hypothetical protein
MANSCEHGNESSCSIKIREFLDKLNELSASQDGLALFHWLVLGRTDDIIFY